MIHKLFGEQILLAIIILTRAKNSDALFGAPMNRSSVSSNHFHRKKSLINAALLGGSCAANDLIVMDPLLSRYEGIKMWTMHLCASEMSMTMCACVRF